MGSSTGKGGGNRGGDGKGIDSGTKGGGRPPYAPTPRGNPAGERGAGNKLPDEDERKDEGDRRG